MNYQLKREKEKNLINKNDLFSMAESLQVERKKYQIELENFAIKITKLKNSTKNNICENCENLKKDINFIIKENNCLKDDFKFKNLEIYIK